MPLPRRSMGGYNMAMVDEFLDELTDDYTALYKENAALKAKLKVLVEKVEDYRATGGLHAGHSCSPLRRWRIPSCRRRRPKRDQMLTQAEIDARERIAQLPEARLAAAEERLRQGQEELAEFICCQPGGVREGAAASGGAAQAAGGAAGSAGSRPEDSVQEIEEQVHGRVQRSSAGGDGATAETQTEADAACCRKRRSPPLIPGGPLCG
ncbi:MAG: DivIVA domain-containing protein [Dysosmobacter sp.]